MAQDEFIALIEGQADLTKAKQAFESFKKQVEQPIKITIDTSGLNVAWGNMQKQFQQQGANLGNSLTQGLNRAVKNVKIDQKPLTSLFDDSQLGGSIMSALGADTKFAEAFKKELEAINAEGAKINNIHFGNLGKSFSAEVESANTKIKVMGHLVEEFDKSGKILQGAHWEFNQSYFTDFEEGARKAQAEAEKLARSLSTIQQNVKNGDFTKQVAKMNADIKNIGKDVPTADISKVVKAATEYSRIVTNITASVNGKSANPLQGQDLVNAYAQAENALRSYNNALSELSSNAKAVGVDTGNAMRQAQAEADKLAQSFKKIKDSFSNGTFGSTFDANIKKMENDLANIGSTVSSDTIKKASDAATEYYRIMQEIQATMDGTAKNPLTQEQVVSQYEKAQVALKQYASACQEVRIEQSATITEGQANKNADAVQAWCNRNSKALKKYGKELEDIQKKMRTTFDANAQKELQQQAQQIYKKAGSEGLTGLSFFDQVKKAFGKIGQFTGIYAVTKQLRQVPEEMVREVIKIDSSMTELRKVSTASAYEIKNYFDDAAESASKYGQAINEVIDSTASWTRLGYDLKDASILTDVTAELAKVGSGLNVDTATEGLQATLKGFSLAADEAKRVGDMINYVADTEPIDAQGIINGLERSSAAMAAANNSLEESIGLITASTSVTQDATAAGTAWRTISMRIRGAKTELEAAGEDTSDMVESVSKLREQVLDISGVDILESNGKDFKSTTQIMRELAQVFDKLSGIDQANLLDMLGGKRGGNVIAAALKNWDIVEDTIRGATYESIGSMDQQLEVYNQSIQASLDKFHVAFQELSYDLINSKTIKGIVDGGTAIIKILDELIEHIGVLGTALTGLGIAKIVTTALDGAKSVEVASDGVELLGTALEAANASGSGLSGVLKGLSGTLGTFGAKASGAGSALGGMFSSLGAFLTTPVGAGAAIAAAVVGAGVLIYKSYKKQQEELIKQATNATKDWGDTRSSIDDYKQQYTELNKQLENSNLTESEKIGIKQQLLALQNEITAKYGEQAKGIDLINGGLETQLGILSNITAEEARRNIRDNREAYELAEKEMTRQRTFKVNNGDLEYISQSGLQSQIVQAFKNAKFEKTTVGFKFTGDAEEFEAAANKVFDELDKLKDEALLSSDRDIIEGITNNLDKEFKKNDETLQKHRDNYKAYVEQQLYKDGFGDELAEYAKRTQEYNDALFSGDADKINEAKQRLDEYKGTVKEITDAHSEYGDFFDEVANSVDKTTEKVYNFKSTIEKATDESSGNLTKYQSKLKNTVNDLKTMGLDGVDVRNILQNGGVGFDQLSELAKLYDENFDFKNEDMVNGFVDVLSQLGIVAGGTGDEIDLAKDSFDGFMKSASASIDTLDKVNASLVNSFKSGGLSARIDAETGELTGDVQTILSAYKKELGDGNIDQLFERTADGIMVNRDALRALQAEQENTTKAEFIKRIKEAEAHLAAATTDDERRAWQTRLDNVKLLASAYDGATSAYQKWVDAQSMGEAGDQYDTIASTALKRGKELYDKGLVGTNEFRAIAQLYSDQDLALASVEELTEAYENGVGTVKKYFTEGQEGAVAFADKMVELGVATKEGDFYNFEEGIDTAQIADELDISVDLVEAAFKKLGDYGFDIHFMSEDQLAEFDTLTEKAEEAQEKLKELRDSGANVGDSDLIDIDLSELDTVKEIDGAIEKLNEAKASPEIDPESAEAYQDIIDTLQEKLDLLSQTDIGNEVNFDNLDSAYTVLGSLQNRLSTIDSMNATSTVDVDVMNDDEVQLLAEQIENFPPEIKTAIGVDGDDAESIIKKMENKEIKIPVEYLQPSNTPTADGGTTTVNVQYSQGDLPTIAPQTVQLDYTPDPIEAHVVADLDHSAVDIYDPDKESPKTGTVVYGKDVSDPEGYEPSPKSATVTYTVSVNGASAVYNLPDSENRYITYHISTVGSAPGNYKGTVPRSAFQGISHASGTAHANGLGRYGLKQDENSLVNELGAEIVVRPSEDSWMIFNDGMPTFAQLRKGDVIFDAEQTRELLSKGWTKNSASILGSSFIGGTARGRKVVGGGSFKKATSSSKSSSGGGGGNDSGGGGGGGDNSKANKEAKDFKETLDKIEIRIDRLDRMISNFDTVASNVFNNLTTRSDALSKSLYVVGTEIKEQERAYNRYIKQANKVGLDSKLAAKVRKGEIDIQDIKNEDTWKKIEEYRKWYEAALDARDAVYKLKADEADLWNQRFELNQTDYENQISKYQHLYDQLDNYISLAENTGRISANKLRLRQIDEENKKISKLKTEYNSLKTIMDKAVASGKIKINSEGYYEMLSTLNDISESIVETTANIEELNKSIRETNWEIFDKGAETISNVRDELEFLYGLLGNEDKMYDEKGVVTSNGVAGFGILSAQYNVAMQEAQKYASEIKSLNQEIASDPYNQDLIDRRQELYESQRQSIEDANNYKESIVDLVENGIKKQIDSLKDLISKYTDLMDAQKDEIDYAKKVADAQNNVNKIQKQLNAYANDDTEEGASRRQKLRNDLKNAQDTLAQTEEERRMSQTKKLLSDLQEEYENILNARLDDVDALIQAVVDGVNVNSSVIVDAIKTASNDVGYIMTEATSTMFNSSTVKDLASYFVNGKFVESVTGIADGVKLITNYYSSAQKDADRREATNIMAERVRSSGTHIQSYTDGNGNKKVGYFKEDGTLDKTHTGWANKDGKIYRFENGQMVSGSKLIDVGGKKYYLDKDGSRVSNVWRNIGGNLYHFNKNGEAETGLVAINGKQFYFDKNGVNKKGLQSVGGSKYYFDTKSGAMIKNSWRQVDGGLYHFGSNGKAASGWMKTDSGKWFFFDPKTNKRVVSQWIHNGAITTKPVKGDYYVGADGVRVVNGKKKTNRGYLTFDANGKWKGYKSGVRSVPSNGMYWTNEGAPETIIRKSDGAILTRLNTNDTVLNNNATQNMWDFANNPQKFLRGLGVNNTYGSGNNVNLEFNLSGLRSPSEFMDALRKDKRFEKLIQEMTLGRVNGHGSLAKNAIRI